MLLSKLIKKIKKNKQITLFNKIGKHSNVEIGNFVNPENIIIEDYVYIGDNASINAIGGVVIKKGTIISSRLTIHTSNHNYNSVDLKSIPYDNNSYLKSVVIEENVWIGDNCMICPGVTIEEGSVVAMGSVVTKNVPKCSIVAGNPAKVVKQRDITKYNELKNQNSIYMLLKNNGKVKHNFIRI